MRVFNETQRFTQWWLWLLLLVATLSVIGKPMLTWIQSDYKLNTTFGTGFYIGCGTLFLVVLLFILFKLKITIDERGLSYQFFPIHFKPKLITWKQIDKIGIRTYKPLMEYGGWGYRLGMGGKAINVKGNKGIQIKLKNGDSLLLGTQKMMEAQTVINRYFKKDEGI
jgi:hypothetical protein